MGGQGRGLSLFSAANRPVRSPNLIVFVSSQSERSHSPLPSPITMGHSSHSSLPPTLALTRTLPRDARSSILFEVLEPMCGSGGGVGGRRFRLLSCPNFVERAPGSWRVLVCSALRPTLTLSLYLCWPVVASVCVLATTWSCFPVFC